MKNIRTLLWIIAILAVIATIIDLPKNYRLNLGFGPVKIDRIIQAPDINLAIGPIVLKKDLSSKFGLDLSGGTHLVLEADMSSISQSDRDNAFNSAKNVVERRVNLYGLTEPVVQQSKVNQSYRLLVEIPGISNVDQAIDLIGKTAQLDFREEGTTSAKASSSSESALLSIFSMKKTGLTGKNLKRSDVTFNTSTGKPEVSLEFDNDGAKLFEEITSRNTGKPLGIFLDDQILSYPPPVVQNAISGGKAVITGGFNVDYAKKLAISLNAGALPVSLKVIEQRNIGATLGAESIKKSIMAGMIGLSIIALFMLVNYGIYGILADVALIIYSMAVFALFKIIPVTLTLAGIAGFILSIGMAVDANILIFERIKEERRWGKSITSALVYGFDRAFPSIRDSNISSLITCAILYWFGTGIIRGFAITLAIGIIISLFSAITITRTFLRMVYK